MNAPALNAFAGKGRRELENTLSVFLSINGFSPDGIAAHLRQRRGYPDGWFPT